MQVESGEELSKIQQWIFVVQDYKLDISIRYYKIEMFKSIPHAARAVRPG